MRYTFVKSLGTVLLFLGFAVFSACHQSSDDNNIPGSTTTPASGEWKITYFWDKNEETGNYTNFVFDFASNGTLTAKNGSQTYSGTWSLGNDDSKNKFIIFFNGTVPSALSDLAEDWVIVEMNDNLMHFEHTSGGNGDTDILKFEKG